LIAKQVGELKVSVIVATRERSLTCRRLCLAVERQFALHPWVCAELILVFDGCPTYDWISPRSSYRLVPLSRRAGIAGARNAGLKAASGDVLAFLDDDCVPVDGWLSSLLRALDAYPEAIAFGGRVVGTDRANLYSQLRDRVYYRETFGPWYAKNASDGDLPGPPYVSGGNCAYRREAIEAARGFDPVLPAYSDVELGRRLRLRQRGVLVAGMSILHDHPGAFGQYMERCARSGRARGLLWARCRYAEDAPGAVARSILANVLWSNVVPRPRRVSAPRAKTVGVLFCQEVVHGIGYAVAVARAGWAGRVLARGRTGSPARGRMDAGGAE
jgi:glycosyltransferase involved in cell wall biosynthesis